MSVQNIVLEYVTSSTRLFFYERRKYSLHPKIQDAVVFSYNVLPFILLKIYKYHLFYSDLFIIKETIILNYIFFTYLY